MKQPSIKDLLVMNSYWLGLSFMWNSLHVIILPAVLLNFVPETLKNTYLGLLTFMGLVVALFIQPLSGAASDRLVSRWGRRRPLIVAGTLADLVFLVFLGWAGGILWLAIGYIGLQFSSNVAHGPAQGIIPDQVPSAKFGAASGFKNVMDMAGLILASLIMGRIYPEGTTHPYLPIAVVIAFLMFSAAVTITGVREKPTKHPSTSADPSSVLVVTTAASGVKPFRLIITTVQRIDFKQNSRFWWLILSRFLFLFGVYDIQAFLQYYLRDVLAVANPIQLTGDLMAVIAVTLTICTLAGGWLGDRYGHKKIQLLASIISSAACALLLSARTTQSVLIFGSFLGVGVGLFLTSNWANASRLAPPAEAGKYLGLTNLATAGAGAFARLGGPLIDVLNHWKPGVFLGYSALFLFGAVLTLFSAFVIGRKDFNEL